MNDMKRYFEDIKTRYPNWKEIITSFIDGLQKQRKNRLVIVSVLSAFQEHTDWKNTFPELYEKYQESNFQATALNDEETHEIMSCYIEEVKKIGREYVDVI